MSASQLPPSAPVIVTEQLVAWHAAGCWLGGGAAVIIGASWLFSWVCRRARPRPAPVLATSTPPPTASPAPAHGRASAPPTPAYHQHYGPPAPYPQHVTYIIESGAGGDGLGAAIVANAAVAGFCAIM